jgi:predicted esterase
MKAIVGLGMFCLAIIQSWGQVDTSYVYRTGNPYGTLDIRVAKSATRYYYLQENKTFSFREAAPGVKTDAFRDMTSWNSEPYTQGNMREKNGSLDAFTMNYRLLFPGNYNASYSPGYPLILMVHGAGERGNCWGGGCYWADETWKPQTNTPGAPTNSDHQLLNNDHNLLHGGQIHLDARNLAGSRLPNDPTMPSRAFQGFVLFPQNINGWDANGCQDVIKLVRLVSKKYNIDENRIYIHGLSNGGYGVYEIIKRAPWLFSAALPMSAISDAGITTYPTVLADMSHIPLWVFQGGIDTNPVPSKTRNYVKKFRDAGVLVRYNEYSNLGHGVWNTAYKEPDFFTWIQNKNKANIHVYAGVAAICRTNNQGVRMALAKGFLAYQWEFNGAIVTGANSPSFTAETPGTYRARFSRISSSPNEGEWNRWSDPVIVTESNPAQAQIIQHGSVLLKDLNNYNNAHLSAAGEFAHYYWYKNGALQDLPGTQDDTTRHPMFKQGTCTDLPACTGNGVYTLITAGFDNCPSPPSEPKYIYFNNQAPVNITAPTSFAGTASSPSTILLSWTDASPNEIGFEIWRRKNTGVGTYTTWQMVALTNANVTTFLDSRLEPAKLYHYKIRAAGSSGRSNYTPSASNQFLAITTQPDTEAPSAPENLTAQASGIRKISLSWQAGTDNTGIRQYLILFDEDTVQTNSATTNYLLTNLDLNQNYNFTVQAEDLGGNLSSSSNTASANTVVNGLYYEHSTGGWSDLDQIDWNIAEYKGKVANFTLAPRTQEDYFNFKFDGYLYITLSGTYQFRTTSDDGSRLTLEGTSIVDNDGLHGNVTVTSGNQELLSGPQLINVKYFEYGGGQTLTVQYRGPDTNNNWLTIPDAVLRSDNGSFAAREASKVIMTPSINDATFNVYPNPLSGDQSINIQMEGENTSPIIVEMVNMMGEGYYEKIFNAQELNEGSAIVPHKHMQHGVYILIIRQGDQQVKKRIVVNEN